MTGAPPLWQWAELPRTSQTVERIHPERETAPHNHSETSKAAAESISEHLPRLEALVLEAIRGAGSEGLTDEEAQEVTGLQGSTERPRRIRLWEKGLVVRAGVQRKTKAGRLAEVWVAK